MFGLFGPKCPLDDEEWEWQLAAFAWLERQFGPMGPSQARMLARPDGDEFPDIHMTGHELAEQLLVQIKAIAGMADWPTELIPFQNRQQHATLSRGIALAGGSAAAGTFRLVKTEQGQSIAEFCYSWDDVGRPAMLVGTLAHEMAHYLLHSAPLGPGGEDCDELMTDLTAIWLGFGIFLGNQARYGEHVANDHGYWYQSGHRGYLSERARMTALAISETLADRDPLAAAPYLKAYLVDDLKQAVRYIGRRDIRADMAAIDLADYGC